MRGHFFILAFLLLLISCECYAKVFNKDKSFSETISVEIGHFKISYFSEGFKCPPIGIILEYQYFLTYGTYINFGGPNEIRFDKIKSQQSDSIEQRKSLDSIWEIFENYKTNEEGIESNENKTVMTRCLARLKNVTNSKDLELLINIWNYYDPTDYSCGNEIYDNLKKNKALSVIAVKNRIKNKMSWEGGNLEGTDFKELLNRLENE